MSRVIAFVVGLISLVLIFIFHERHLSQLDPANLFLAAKYGMNLMMERPHAPGYPFFVLFYSGIASIFRFGIHSAMLFMNACFAAVAIMMLWKLCKNMFSEGVAAIAVALMALNPLFLFYSSTAETYAFDAFIGTLAMYGVLHLPIKARKYLWFLLGIAGGFRLSSVILLAMVLGCYSLVEQRKETANAIKNLLMDGTLFLIGIACWLVPFIATVPIGSSWSILFFDGTLNPGPVSQSLVNFTIYLFWTVNVGLIAILVLVFNVRKFLSKRVDGETCRKNMIIAIWILLPSLYFALRTYSKGYMLLILPALCIGLARIVSKIGKPVLRIGIATAFAAVNLAIFLFFPYITPPVDITTSKRNLPFGQRLQAAEERAVSFFLPSRSHLAEMDGSFEEFEDVVHHIPNRDRAMLMIDRSAEIWIVPRAVVCADPNIKIVSLDEAVAPNVKLNAEDSIDLQFPESNLLLEAELYYVTEARSLSRAACPGILVKRSPRFCIYEIPMSTRNEFLAFMDQVR